MTATATVQAFFAALARGAWDEAAAMVEPASAAAETPVEVPLRVLGEVPFGDDLAYVVYLYDETADPDPDDERIDPVAGAPHAESVPVHRRDGRWYLGLNIDLRTGYRHATMLELFEGRDEAT